MTAEGIKEAAEFISNELRLRTLPLAVKFLKDTEDLPAKSKRPSVAMGKRITICQAVTMARVYGWSMGVSKEDLICVPAMITFGMTKASRGKVSLGKLFCDVSFHEDVTSAEKETGTMSFLEKEECKAIALSPLAKGLYEPDTVTIYGNPAQITRMVQAWVHEHGERVSGNLGGKVECSEYLIAPYKQANARVAVPGAGDRIFSMTQDDEMVFALPCNGLESLVRGLKEAGKKIGAKYPITFYQNFQPEFPKQYKTAGEEVGIC